MPERDLSGRHTRFLDDLSAPDSGAPAGTGAAVAGTLAASLIASVCLQALDQARSEKAEDELRALHDRAISLRRDLLALVDHGARAAEAVAAAQRGGQARLRALMFASEVPLRTAESCHALLNLALRALGRAGVRAIADLGTGAALAHAGVVGGIVTARTYLAGVPEGSGIGAAAARKRAERIFRDAESLRTQVIDRVRVHLP